MRKYVIIEIKSEKKSLRNLLQFIWWLSKETIIFIGCLVLAILMFTS